ncbi:MIP/aquaporin family protein [Sporichthya brevicatena]|uniref:MIP/aquaporin family protein n=1 Tax=Sporichthya brevicatena TaxID=171442 RepID=A0ABP3RUM6_9ACTN
MTTELRRRALSEFVGTGGLVTVVVGSGIAAQRLSPDDVGLQLLQNSMATALGLTVLILVLAPVSGGHLNPAVTLAAWALDRRSFRGPEVAAYVSAQTAGAIAGTWLAHGMFDVGVLTTSTHARNGGPTLVAEVVATAGLVLVIFALVRSSQGPLCAPAVGAYIGAAYWFTSSTSFANPAVTVGRAFTDTFAGIAPSSVPGFVAAQLVGAALGLLLLLALYPTTVRGAVDA